MAKVIKTLYYDGNGHWGTTRPQPSVPLPKQQILNMANVHFAPQAQDTIAESTAKRVADALKARMPAIIALNGVSRAAANAFMSQEWIRSDFAASELTGAMGSILLWRSGLPVLLAEQSDKPSYIAIHMKKYGKVVATSFDPGMSPAEKGRLVGQLVSKTVPDTDSTCILLFNPTQSGGSLNPDAVVQMREAVHAQREAAKFSAPPSHYDATIWLQSPTMSISSVTPSAELPDGVRAASFISVSVSPTSPGLPAATPAQFTVPPATSLGDAAPADGARSPGTRTAEEQSDGGIFPSSPAGAKKRVWSMKHSSAIRVRDGTEETSYDLTPFFTKLEDGLKALNNGAITWNADYAILHSRLLAVHGANADIPSFRQYMNTHSPPSKPPELVQPTPARPGSPPPNAAVKDDRLKRKEGVHFSPCSMPTPALSAARRRSWSAGRAVMLYQVTPREMKFDITELVGVSPGAVAQAVARLNGVPISRTKSSNSDDESDIPDPLSGYRYDYALVYGAGRQGYWLLAATDVPCDVASCRAAAKFLAGPVAMSL